MINDLDIVQWEYLLSPEFELINSAGKPLTGGWIEVYLHGTRDKYYCASDFDGTLHPFKIPLDSIGANVVLADPNNAYDVYVYNKFGSLIMSRYNVKCQGSGGSSTYVGDKLYYGQYRANNVTTIASLRRNKGNINLTNDGYLKLKSGMSYHITIRGSFTVDDPANEDTTLNYIEYTSVNPIKIDIDETKEGPQYFELSYDIYRLQEDMDYQVAFAQSNGMVTDLIVEVHSLSNLATSAAGGDQEYEAGWGIDITNNVVSVDPSILEDYEYTAGDYISIDENNVISVTGINPGDFATHDEVHEATVTAIELVTGLIPEAQVQSDWNETDTEDPAYIKNKPDLDIYATHDEVNNVSGKIIETVNNVSGVLHEEVMEVSGSIIHYQGASGINVEGDTISLEEPLYIEAGSGINFTSEGDTITINADPIDLSDYVTHVELEEAISAVTGIGDYGQFYATDISGAATMARTKGTIDVTNDGKIKLKKGSSYHVTMRGRYNQTTASNTLSTLSLIEYITNNSISVNVDTTITDSQYFEISYDLYKLNSDTNYYVFFNVPAGKINDLFVEIHAIGSVGAGVSGGAGTEYDAGWGIQILNNVISVDPSILNDYTTNGDVYNSTVSAINLVTGMIPEAQVQSDWTEDDSEDPAYIKNKPEEYNLVAGDNITIDVSGTNIVISSEGGIASGASGCNVEFVNIYDYRGQITDREPGAQTTYTGGTALANAMRDIMLRGHMPLLVYGAPAAITEVFTPIWLDTREFAVGTNPGYSCVPLTGHEFFFKNPVTSFVTTKIVIDALNDKISDFIVSADTVATVGRGLTVDYFGAGDPWVWYEGHGPTPPVSAATTPGLCRIEIASSIPDVTQVQTMIDTSIAALPITGLPTTELGKFTIQSNVSGGPIEVICPTDQAPDAVFYQIDSVSGNAIGYSITIGIVNYYYGETPADFNGSDDSVLFTIDDNLTNISSIVFYYTTGETGTGGPNLTTSVITGGDTGIVQSGDYKLKAQYNQAGTSSPYGKYLEIMFNWKNCASDTAQSLQWTQDALSKITFFGVVRPDPSLGSTVNLSRYYLSNDVNSSTLSSDLACQVTVDDTTKQQKVYMPGYMPSSWQSNIAQAFEYGSNYNSPSTTNYGAKQYRAYKYTSSPVRYQFAYCTDWDYVNKLMTFVAYDNSGNAIEKWTLDYTTYGSNVWTTTPISAGSTYTAGEHISIENDEIAVTGITELVAGENITITTSGASAIISGQAGGSSYTAGTGIDITSDVISVDNTVAMKSDLPAPISGASGITVEDSVVSLDNPIGLVAGNNITIQVSGVSAIISSTGGGGGGTEYTAGTGIDITNNEISVDNTVALKTDVTAAVSGKSDKFTVLTYDVSTWSDFQAALNNNSIVLAKWTISNSTDYFVLSNIANNTATFTNLRKVNHSATYQSDITTAVTLNSNNVWDSLGEESTAVSVKGGNGINQSYSANELTLSINATEIATAVSGLLPGGVTPVQSNWNETNTSSLAYIQNKPTIPAAQVQANWNETSSSSMAYIKNKPNMSNYVTTTSLSNTLDTYLKKSFERYDSAGLGINAITAAAGIGKAKLRFQPGNLLTSYNLLSWSYCENLCYWGTNRSVVEFELGISMNNVIGTQWSEHNNVITLGNGNFIHQIYSVNGDAWTPTTIILKTYNNGTWVTSLNGILRDVRNSSAADNNVYLINVHGFINLTSY